jgi:hypothetical protein
MLGHAPPPLTANGLDMRDGHPAERKATEGSQARFSRLGALDRRKDQNKRKDEKRKGAATRCWFAKGRSVAIEHKALEAIIGEDGERP